MCIDYLAFNKVSVLERYPLPCIDELLAALHGCTIFSSLDLGITQGWVKCVTRHSYVMTRSFKDVAKEAPWQTYQTCLWLRFGYSSSILSPVQYRNSPPRFSVAGAVVSVCTAVPHAPPLALVLSHAQAFHCRPQLAALCLTMSHATGNDTTGSEEVCPDAPPPHLPSQGFATKSPTRGNCT